MIVSRINFKQDGERKLTPRYYAKFRDHQEISRRLALFEDLRNSNEAGRAIERLVSIRASGDIIPVALRDFIDNTLPSIRKKLAEWNIIEPMIAGSAMSLEELVDDWKKDLLAEENDAGYVDLKVSRVRNLLHDARVRRWSHITPKAVRDQLKKYRDDPKRKIGVVTSNHYLQAIMQFCTWVVKEKKLSQVSPLAGMTKLDECGELRHERRALSAEEFQELLAYLETAPAVMKISADHRTLVYAFGVATGLRFGAIERVPAKHIQIHERRPCVFVPKRNRIKYSVDRWIPLDDELWTMLRSHVETRQPNEPVFQLPKRGHGAKMVRRDLEGARAAWIEKAATPEERQRREASDFLKYQDSDGRFADFHGLRHTRAVWLFKHHKAEPRDVQALMGVGSMSVVDRYARSYDGQHDHLVNRGPKLKPTPTPTPATDVSMPGNLVPQTTEGTEMPDADTEHTDYLPRDLPKSSGNEGIQEHSAGQLDVGTILNSTGLKLAETPEKAALLTSLAGAVKMSGSPGEVAEWLNAPVSKTG
jgi:integrase